MWKSVFSRHTTHIYWSKKRSFSGRSEMKLLLPTIVVLVALLRVEPARGEGGGDHGLREFSGSIETGYVNQRRLKDLLNFYPAFKNYPLGNCEGDCDEDGHCDGELKCFFRRGLETVPGCTGEGVENNDYVCIICYDSMSTD